ncbi:MAG: hypothetical protein ABIZ70_03385 [Gemmatimonadales bacterium]
MSHRLIALALLAAACGTSPVGPGDTLTGNWSTAEASLAATSTGVVWSQRCLRAHFSRITLGENGDFTAESDTLTQVGNIRPTPGAKLTIQGRFVGRDLRLEYSILTGDGPPHEPAVTELTLSAGRLNDPLVCNY